jgi:hypothetical protein
MLANGARSNRGRGFLLWGALVMVMALSPFWSQPLSPGPGIKFGEFSESRIIATSSVPMRLLSLLGGVVSAAICVLWYRFFGSRERRGMLARSIGYCVFAIGSILPFPALSTFADHEVMAARGLGTIDTLPLGPLHVPEPLVGTTLFLIFSGVLLSVAHFLQFKRGRPTGLSTTPGEPRHVATSPKCPKCGWVVLPKDTECFHCKAPLSECK